MRGQEQSTGGRRASTAPPLTCPSDTVVEAGGSAYPGQRPVRSSRCGRRAPSTGSGSTSRTTGTTATILSTAARTSSCGSPTHGRSSTAARPAPLVSPLFFQDGQHTFYVEPALTETTLERLGRLGDPVGDVAAEFDSDDFWDRLDLLSQGRWRSRRRIRSRRRPVSDPSPRGLGQPRPRFYDDSGRRPARSTPAPGASPTTAVTRRTWKADTSFHNGTELAHRAPPRRHRSTRTIRRAPDAEATSSGPTSTPTSPSWSNRLVEGSVPRPAGRRHRGEPLPDGSAACSTKLMTDDSAPTDWSASRARSRTSTSAPAARTRSTTGSSSTTCR